MLPTHYVSDIACKSTVLNMRLQIFEVAHLSDKFSVYGIGSKE